MAEFVSIIRRMYLTTYNWVVCAGWFNILFLALKTLNESGHEHVYRAIEKPLLLAQSAAFFEILHGCIGLVRSPISATLPQVSSRLYVVWGILYNFPEVQTHPLVSFMAISWCITEIIRYSFFGIKEAFGSPPFWLLWLRYSTFLVLYPCGIASEVSLIYNALPFIKESGFCSVRMPNKWNFSFDYFYCAIMVLGVYIPGITHFPSLHCKLIRFFKHSRTIFTDEDDKDIYVFCIDRWSRANAYPTLLHFFRDSPFIWSYAWAKEENSI